MDDVAEFLSTHCTTTEEEVDAVKEKKGCNQLNSFINYISERETENFRLRRHDNQNSVTLTTIHQVFVIHSSSPQFGDHYRISYFRW